MQTVLEMIAAALAQTWEAVEPRLTAVPVWAWTTVGTVAVVLTLFVVLRPRFGSPLERLQRPELMLSRAELVPDPEGSGSYRLVAAFSNLHHGPVQLLRIAAAGGDEEVAVVESTALVMARRAVELEADLRIVGGGRGRLELYLYVPSSSARAWRLRVPMTWEAWSRRFKAETLKQRLDPVNELPEPPTPRREAPPALEPEPSRPRVRRDFPDRF